MHVSDSESEENSKNFDESADNTSIFTNSSKKGRSRVKKKVFSMQEEEEEGLKQKKQDQETRCERFFNSDPDEETAY